MKLNKEKQNKLYEQECIKLFESKNDSYFINRIKSKIIESILPKFFDEFNVNIIIKDYGMNVDFQNGINYLMVSFEVKCDGYKTDIKGYVDVFRDVYFDTFSISDII